MNLSDYKFTRLTSEIDLSLFNCDDDDLNDFIRNDAWANLKELMAVTYLWIDNNNPIAFISLINSKIEKDESVTFWNLLSRPIPNTKRRKTYPAVLIGRLGVSVPYQCTGFGSQILTFLKAWFKINNKTGCRFLVVDAYNKESVLHFYEKNGFKFLTDKDKSNHTRIMFYDLIQFEPAFRGNLNLH